MQLFSVFSATQLYSGRFIPSSGEYAGLSLSLRSQATRRTRFDLASKAIRNKNPEMIAETIPELKSLTFEQKLILVGEIWDELATHPDAFPLREDHIKVLRERLEHYRQHPEDTVSWEAVKARILSSR